MVDPKSGIHYLVFTIKYTPLNIKLCILYLMGFGQYGHVMSNGFRSHLMERGEPF